MKVLNIIGLVFGVCASMVFFFDSTRLSGRIISLLNHLHRKTGVFDGKPSMDELVNLNMEAHKSRNRSVFGYVLFALGFLLQLIATILGSETP